jgi:ketosteroid isomerase-like protein
MVAQEDLQLIEDLYRTFQRGEIADVLNVIHQDAELNFEGPTSIPWAGNWRGRDGWLSFFQSLGHNADEIALQMQPFAVDDDRVVAVGRYQARVKKTGKRIDSPLVHLWTLRDGKVVHCLEMTNTAVEVEAFVE